MENELFNSNFNKVVPLMLKKKNLHFLSNVLVFCTALINSYRKNDGILACKKFPGCKRTIK